MERRKGFFLFEFMVYFFCTTYTIVLAIGFFLFLYTRIKHSMQDAYSFVQLCTATAFLKEKLRLAPCCADQWKKHDSKYMEYIYTKNDGEDVGFSIQNNKLICKKGAYDKRVHRWKKRNRITIAQGIKSLVITFIYEKETKNIDGLILCIKTKNENATRDIFITRFL